MCVVLRVRHFLPNRAAQIRHTAWAGPGLLDLQGSLQLDLRQDLHECLCTFATIQLNGDLEVSYNCPALYRRN